MAPPKKDDSTSVVDSLREMISTTAEAMTAHDAGPFMPQLQQLQAALVKMLQGIAQQKAQQAAQMQQQQAQQAAGQQQQQAGMAAGMGGGMPPQKGMPGGPPSQGGAGMPMPNPDELRRVLAARQAG